MADGNDPYTYPLLPLATARARLRTLRVRPARSVIVPVAEAVGRYAARSIEAPANLPPRTTAAMDGYALAFRGRHAPTEFRLRLGSPPGRLSLNEAAVIATGEPVPAGSRAVARLESTRRFGDRLRLVRSVTAGADLHAPGDSIRKGMRLVRRGERLDAYTIGSLVAANVRSVRVWDLRAAVIATGSEFEDAAASRPGRVDSLGPMIRALLEPGVTVDRTDPVPDEPARLSAVVRSAARTHDLVITIGGSSVGPRDVTKRAIERVGRIIVPGARVNVLKRAGVGWVAGTPVLIVPGQVESAVVAIHEYGQRLLARLVGGPVGRTMTVPLGRAVDVRHRMDSTYFFRVEGGRAFPLPWGVARYRPLQRADGFGYLARGRRHPEGEPVPLVLLRRPT